MNTFGRIKDWTEPVLVAAGFSDVPIYPGPELPDIPNHHVIWTPYGGTGLEGGEGILDGRSWQARCVGNQSNYTDAESIANAIDIAMISHYSRNVGGLWVSQIRRVGGAPNPLMTDEANRTHFVCSYIVSVKTALPN